MSCKMWTFYNSSARGNVRGVMNEATGIAVFMPGYQMFQDIRFHIETYSGSHGGGRLSEAYDAEGYPFYPTVTTSASGLDQAFVNENIVPCVKAIYQQAEYDPIKKMYVDRTPGEWIYQEACRCVLMSEPSGRLNLGNGFVVPSPQEQININALMGQKSYTFLQAILQVCPDIIPPVDSISQIEKYLSTTLRWTDIYRSARADWIVLNNITNPPATTPSTTPTTTPPATMPSILSSNNLMIIGALAIALMVLKK